MNISDLHLLEETIPELLDQLTQSIREDGCVKHPIIIDKKSLVVLDGVHRVAALERLGCRWVPAFLVDYENPAVKVGCWYRTLRKINAQEVANFMAQTGSTVDKIDEVKEGTIGVSPVVAALKTRESAFLIRSPFESLKQAYNLIERIEERLKKEGIEISYETESDALHRLREKQIDGVILTPRPNKKAVVDVALSGDVFAHKATRHVVPARPLCINVPLSLLKDSGKTLDEVNMEFEQMLRKKRLKRVASGSIFEGRRYEEDLYIFE